MEYFPLGDGMKVQCVICDQESFIEEDSPLAKRLRNRPLQTFMCVTCSNRIKEKTEKRLATGKFILYPHRIKKDDF